MLSIFSKPGDSVSKAHSITCGVSDLRAGEDVDRENPLPQMEAKIQDVKRAILPESAPIVDRSSRI